MKPPIWFNVVAALALLWNLMGCLAFSADLLQREKMLERMEDTQRVFAESLPQWLTIFYGIAVVGGTIGCLGLLLRQSWSTPVLVVSLVAAAIQFSYVLFVARGLQINGAAYAIMPAMIIVIGIMLVWLSVFAVGKGWIGGE